MTKTKEYKTGDWIENKGVVVQPENGPAFAVYPKDIDDEKDWWNGKRTCEDIFAQMPTLKQLQLIFENKELINKTLKENGGEPLKDVCYWSSTEDDSTVSWELNVGNGGDSNSFKNSNYYVRPVLAL